MKEYKDNIVHDSYYLINKFKERNMQVTQLQIQKIMYFFEAYYMCEEDTSSLYDCHFNAWMYGPVAIPLHNEFKAFQGRPITLPEDKEKIGYNIEETKRKMLDYIFDVFGEIPAKRLVGLTHMEGSPWYNKWIENGQKVVYGEASYIDKIATKKWFKETFA